MAPTLIVLALLVLGVGIVVFATRRKPGEQTPPHRDQDTAWNDPMTSAESPPSVEDPFANAPIAAPPASTPERQP